MFSPFPFVRLSKTDDPDPLGNIDKTKDVKPALEITYRDPSFLSVLSPVVPNKSCSFEVKIYCPLEGEFPLQGVLPTFFKIEGNVHF